MHVFVLGSTLTMTTIDTDQGLSIGVTCATGLGLGLLTSWLFNLALKRKSVAERKWATDWLPVAGSLALWGFTLAGVSLALMMLRGALNQTEWTWASRLVSLLWLSYMASSAMALVRVFYAIQRHRANRHEPGYLNRILLVRKSLGTVVGGLTIIYGLRILGFDTAPLLAGGALGGIVLGLAFQQSLSNVFSGILFTWDGSIRIGDLVQFQDGKEGFLEKIGWRSSVVRLDSDKKLVIPNSKISESVLVNLGRNRSTLANATLIVPADADVDALESAAIAAAQKLQHEFGDKSSKPCQVIWDSRPDGSLLLRLTVPVSDASQQFAATSELAKAVHRLVRDSNGPPEGDLKLLHQARNA